MWKLLVHSMGDCLRQVWPYLWNVFSITNSIITICHWWTIDIYISNRLGLPPMGEDLYIPECLVLRAIYGMEWSLFMHWPIKNQRTLHEYSYWSEYVFLLSHRNGYPFTYKYTHMYVYTHTNTYTHMYVHKHTQTHTCTHMNIYKHTYIHDCIHTHTFTTQSINSHENKKHKTWH